MRVISMSRMRLIDRVFYRPRTRYVVAEADANAMVQIETSRRQAGMKQFFTDIRVSHMNNYERRYAGQPADNKSILLYRHNAYGDTLMATSVVQYIKERYPKASLTVYSHHDMFDMWKGNPLISEQMAVPLPMSFDAVMDYDWHILYEMMFEGNLESDQRNCYEDQFQFCGFSDVPDRYKRPFITIRPDDHQALDYLKDEIDLDSKFIVYQLAPNNLNRSYPLRLSVDFWKLFMANYPGWKIYVVGLDEYVVPYSGRTLKNIRGPMFEGLPADQIVNLLSKLKSFRHMIPLIDAAQLVVCPDSSVMHLAACFPHVPVLSLWGTHHPDSRAKYYLNNYPLWHPEVCDKCPCYNNMFEIPQQACEKNCDVTRVRGLSADPQNLEWCSVIAAITPEEIMSKVACLLNGERSPNHVKFEATERPPQKVNEVGELSVHDIKNADGGSVLA